MAAEVGPDNGRMQELVQRYQTLQQQGDPGSEAVWRELEPLILSHLENPPLDIEGDLLDFLTDLQAGMQPDTWQSIATSTLTAINEDQLDQRKDLKNVMNFLRQQQADES